MTKFTKLFLVLPLLLATGCFSSSRKAPKVIIVSEDDVPRQIVDERKIKMRVFDKETQTEAFEEKEAAGYFALSPSLYKKLVRGNLKSAQEEQSEKK